MGVAYRGGGAYGRGWVNSTGGAYRVGRGLLKGAGLIKGGVAYGSSPFWPDFPLTDPKTDPKFPNSLNLPNSPILQNLQIAPNS